MRRAKNMTREPCRPCGTRVPFLVPTRHFRCRAFLCHRCAAGSWKVLVPFSFESSSHNASRSFCVFVPGEERIGVESASFQFAQQDVLIDRTVIDHGGGVRIVGHHLSD